MLLGARIKKARLRAGLTQGELAEMTGVSRSAVARWESDDIEPGVRNLAELAINLNVTTDYLLGLDDRDSFEVTGMQLSPEAEKALGMLLREIRKENRDEKD